MKNLGLHLAACPRMGSINATLTDELWDFDTLIRNTLCNFCNRQKLNDWYSCNRRPATINLHPGLTAYRRQHLYLVAIFAKYAVCLDSEIPFQGHPGAVTIKQTHTFTNISLPKSMQVQTFIRHGKCTILLSIFK